MSKTSPPTPQLGLSTTGTPEETAPASPPTLDLIVEYTKSVGGRDKLAKLVQYICRLVVVVCGGSLARLAAAARTVEQHMSAGRKVYRLGRSADFLKKARESISISDAVIRQTTLVNSLCLAAWFAGDNVMWAIKLGLVAGGGRRLGKALTVVSVVGMLAALTKDLYRVAQWQRNQRKQKTDDASSSSSSAPESDRARYFGLPPTRAVAMLDAARTVTDWLLTLVGLGLPHNIITDLLGLCLNLKASTIACVREFIIVRTRLMEKMKQTREQADADRAHKSLVSTANELAKQRGNGVHAPDARKNR